DRTFGSKTFRVFSFKIFFGFIPSQKVAIFTTPNCEFNVLFPDLKGFRHWDHKFEWNRKEFEEWCNTVLDKFPDYTVTLQGVGDPPPESSHVGSLSQLAVFTLKLTAQKSHEVNSNLSKETYILINEEQYPDRSENDPEPIRKSGNNFCNILYVKIHIFMISKYLCKYLNHYF
ncbi:small RNA 2'-O-methyltransferase, partial [Caerostris extrusa]